MMSVTMYKRRPPLVLYGHYLQGLGVGCVVSLAGEKAMEGSGGGVLVNMLTVYSSMIIFTLYLNSNYVYYL